MSGGKTILNVESPKTQAIDSVKALLSWKGRAADPLPAFVEMSEGDNRLVLVLSNKKDCFYVVTARDCSCPARGWHPNQPCKHQRKYFPEVKATKPTAIIMERKPFRPFLEDEARPARAALSNPLYVDTTPDTSPAEVAYFERKGAAEFLPMEA